MTDSREKSWNRAYIACLVVLLIAAAGMEAAIKITGRVLEKDPIDLRRSLDEIDRTALTPYSVTDRGRIQNKDVEESLGTVDYIQWQLEDTEADPESPVRYCTLFITYYGRPDRVPHVPEECYFGGGSTRLSRDEMELTLQDGRTIPARHLVFQADGDSLWRMTTKFPVLYFFKVNNEFANGRMEVREALGKNIFGRHSYFSKVEWRFFGSRYGVVVYPDTEQTRTASEKLMSRLVPVLEQQHWPDLDLSGPQPEKE